MDLLYTAIKYCYKFYKTIQFCIIFYSSFLYINYYSAVGNIVINSYNNISKF